MTNSQQPQTYIFAIRRGAEPLDFAARLSGVPGLSVKLPGTRKRVQATATEKALDEVRRRLGSEVLIEPLQRYSAIGKP